MKALPSQGERTHESALSEYDNIAPRGQGGVFLKAPRLVAVAIAARTAAGRPPAALPRTEYPNVRRLGRVSSVALLVAVLASTGVPGMGQGADPGARPPSTEESVGPFPSWTNVNTAYRAIGDGANDDTDALSAR